jgi:membrane protease YdiL (CAAX protease family)
VICYLVIVVAIQMPVVFVYLGLLYTQGATTAQALLEGVQPDRLPMWLYLALKIGEVVLLVPMTFAFCRFVDRRPFVELGFARRPGWVQNLVLGAAMAAVQIALIAGVAWAAGWIDLSLAPLDLFPSLWQSTAAFALFALVALGEELFFRGYVQVNLDEGLGVLPSIALSSILFALFHGLNPNLNALGLLNIALAGCLLGYGRSVTGGLWFPIAYHWSWNLIQGAGFAFPVSGVRYAGLIAVADAGTAPWLTGGAFGPEGGLLGTLALLAAFPLLWLWGRYARRPDR